MEKPRPVRVCLQLPEWMIDFYLGRVLRSSFGLDIFGLCEFRHFAFSKVALVRRAIWSWHCKTVRRLRAVPPPSCHVWTCDANGPTAPPCDRRCDIQGPSLGSGSASTLYNYGTIVLFGGATFRSSLRVEFAFAALYDL